MGIVKRRGKVIAISTGVVGVVLLVAAGYDAKDRIWEEWYLWQVRRVKIREDEIRSHARADLESEIVVVRRSSLRPLPPPIDTTVNAVDAKKQVVLLATGTDQKVEVGFEFTVYRGHEFIAKVKVNRVFQDLCGAEILFIKEGAEIRRGDKAATQI